MENIQVNITRINVNAANPRSISDKNFDKLVTSILVLPKMLRIRPIVVDNAMTALGGNMRLRALQAIADMSEYDIKRRLSKSRDFNTKTSAEQQIIIDYWMRWKDKPTADIVKATELTDAEKREFIIKDNGDFGQWDYDALANDWDADDLNDWGVDVWQNKEVDDVFKDKPEAPTGGSSVPFSPEATEILANEQDNDTPVDFGGNLPAELQGVDLNPENLPKVQGTDETPFERIIIVYSKDRKGEICSLLGLPDINKVVYHLDEILGEAHPTATDDEE